MDTLAIIQKLKKKRPELANDPLMAELELGLDPMSEEDMAAMPPEMSGTGAEGDEEGLATSYLDAEGEEGADALMADLDAEEGIDPMPAEDESAPAASYLDSTEEEDEEMEMPRAKPSRTKQTRRFGGFAR